MPDPRQLVYGAVTWLEKIKMVFTLLPLPIAMVWRLLASPFVAHDRHKTWHRVLFDASFRYSSSSLRVNQIQNLLGTDRDVYNKWTRRQKVEKCVAEIGDGATLMWLSEKRTEKVILYIHGGCYCLPMQDFAADYWKQSVDSINKGVDSNLQVGLVALNYSLIPTASFPTPLKQIMLAIQYLISNGTKPENIHLAGESAGGGLVLEVLSHLINPLPDPSVPKLELPGNSRLGSLCIMSPIVALDTNTASYSENSDKDLLPAYSWAELYDYSAPFLRSSDIAGPYVEALRAPEGWFDGADKCVKRIWVSVGEYECLRDGVLRVMKKISSEGDGFLTTYVDPKGVHNSQYLDCMAGETGVLGSKILEWVKESVA